MADRYMIGNKMQLRCHWLGYRDRSIETDQQPAQPSARGFRVAEFPSKCPGYLDFLDSFLNAEEPALNLPRVKRVERCAIAERGSCASPKSPLVMATCGNR